MVHGVGRGVAGPGDTSLHPGLTSKPAPCNLNAIRAWRPAGAARKVPGRATYIPESAAFGPQFGEESNSKMSLSQHADELLQRGFSRRQLGKIASLLTAGAALPFYNEFAMAQQDVQRRAGRGGRAMDPNAVRINQNENPMGPCKEGLEAIAKAAPLGWRYSPGNETGEMVRAIAEMENVPTDHIAAFAGSSDPLHRVACAFTSPTASWTMGDPGYQSGAPAFIGSKVVKVPLRSDFAHDGAAMIKADPNAGAYYVCN